MTILIPSCNRAEMAWKLCNQLSEAKKIILWVNNCSVFPYYEYKWGKNVRIEYHPVKGCPKACHNLTFRAMMQDVTEDVLVLEDDCTVCDDFFKILDYFTRSIKMYSYMGSPLDMPFALTPIYIPEKKCNYTPAEEKELLLYSRYKLFTQKYVDGIFYMNKSMVHEVKHWLMEDVPVRKSSSGIGYFLSNKMYDNGFKMYGISPSLVGHGDHESIQFGDRRKLVPLIAKI